MVQMSVRRISMPSLEDLGQTLRAIWRVEESGALGLPEKKCDAIALATRPF